jgi:hypothetical protein
MAASDPTPVIPDPVGHPITQAFLRFLNIAIRRSGDDAGWERLQFHRWLYGGATDEESCKRDIREAFLARLNCQPLCNDADRAARLETWEEALRLMDIPLENKRWFYEAPGVQVDLTWTLPPYLFRAGFSANMAHYPTTSASHDPYLAERLAADHRLALACGGWYGTPRDQEVWVPPEFSAIYQPVEPQHWRVSIPGWRYHLVRDFERWKRPSEDGQRSPGDLRAFLETRYGPRCYGMAEVLESGGTFGYYHVIWFDEARQQWRRLNDLD